MSILLIFILWTWGLTPLWVNITGTVILGTRAILEITKDILESVFKRKQKELNEQKQFANMLKKISNKI